METLIQGELRVSSKIVVVDYGMGNLWSVTSALRFLGANCITSGEPDGVQTADVLILPGVGSFRKAMHTLTDRRLIDPLREAVEIRQRKILGICLGFQLMADSGTEEGYTSGLGLIAGAVERFSPDEVQGRKIPHIGFNRVTIPGDTPAFSGFSDEACFYFVHSYRLLSGKLTGQIALCNHGINFVAAYQQDNIFGTQFHPEKSQTNGLRFLSNFLKV